jgi:hypothetical protein
MPQLTKSPNAAPDRQQSNRRTSYASAYLAYAFRRSSNAGCVFLAEGRAENSAMKLRGPEQEDRSGMNRETKRMVDHPPDGTTERDELL